MKLRTKILELLRILQCSELILHLIHCLLEFNFILILLMGYNRTESI